MKALANEKVVYIYRSAMFFAFFGPKKAKNMKPQGFASWRESAASCFWSLDTPEACKRQKRFIYRFPRFALR